MMLQLIGPRPLRPLDTRSAGQKAADAIETLDRILLNPSERAAAAIGRIDEALGPRAVCACAVCDRPMPYVAVVCPACERAEHRCAPDVRPIGVPVEHSGAAGRILGIQ